jgi:hypothetical protein
VDGEHHQTNLMGGSFDYGAATACSASGSTSPISATSMDRMNARTVFRQRHRHPCRSRPRPAPITARTGPSPICAIIFGIASVEYDIDRPLSPPMPRLALRDGTERGNYSSLTLTRRSERRRIEGYAASTCRAMDDNESVEGGVRGHVR